MIFLRRLNGEKKTLLAPEPPKLKRDWLTIIPPVLIFLANLFLILPLFKQSLPVESFTAPLLPFLAGGQEWIARLLILIAYLVGPVFVYFYVWEMTQRRLTSFLAALIYTLPTFRLSQIISLGDAAHVVALSFIPLVLIFFSRFLRKPNLNSAIIVISSVVLVALTSPFGLFTLLIFLGLGAYAEMLLGHGRAKIIYTLLILLGAFGVSAFWYHPALVMKIFSAEQGTALFNILWNLVPLSFFLAPVLGAFSFLIFDRKPDLQPVFLSISQFFIFFLLVLVGTHISSLYVPVPSRFLPELSLATAFVLALLLTNIYEIPRSGKIRLTPSLSSKLRLGFLVFIFLFFFVSLLFLRPHFWLLAKIEPEVSGITLNTSEGGAAGVLGTGITAMTMFIIGVLKLGVRLPRV